MDVRQRGEYAKIATGAVIAAIVTPVCTALLGQFPDNPAQYALVLLPAVFLLGFVAISFFRNRRVLLSGGYSLFLVAYCLFFAIASSGELLNFRRISLIGFDNVLPDTPLGLSRLGDWRYRFLPDSTTANPRLLAVTLPDAEPTVLRRQFGALIRQAVARGAKGIAFDYYLDSATETPFDSNLCTEIVAANAAGVSVVFGLQHREESPGFLVLSSLPDSLSCLEPDQFGTLGAYREADGTIRMIPVFLQNVRDQPALSYRVASNLLAADGADALDSPASNLLQFTKPADAEPPVELSSDVLPLFPNRFVLVGSNRAGDHHLTPFGRVPGIQIHLFAVNSLLKGDFVRRWDALLSFPILFSACALLAVVQAQGASRRRLVSATLISIVLMFVIALLAIRFQVWVSVFYPVLATTIFGALLLGGSAMMVKRQKREKALTEAVAASDDSPALFDVFLSHNGNDKPAVRDLAEVLKRRGIKVWLDEEQLAPGRMWQEGLEDILGSVRTAAVLIGPDDLGPWEAMEMRSSLEEAVRRDMPVIPVLLPGSSEKPSLPRFLHQFTWVDLRSGLSDRGIDRLIWGITGVKP